MLRGSSYSAQRPALLLMFLAVWLMPAMAQLEEPSIALAARQSLLDYTAQQGLQLLQQRVQQSLSIPDLSQTFTL
jgi:hypothetical protein